MFRLKLCRTAICLASLFFINLHCTKIDTTTIGNGLIPAVDNVTTLDTTISVTANNFDSSVIDCAKIYPTDDRPFGYISNDPSFGTTSVNIYTEFKPAFFPFAFRAARTLDSVVIILSYRKTYGDSSVPQRVNVFRINETPFVADSSTCTFHDFDQLAIIGSKIFTPQRLMDSVFGFNERAVNQLRIPLSNAFGQSILSLDSTSGFKNDSAFKRFISGFAITPDLNFGGNSLSFFNLADTNSRLAIYYHYLDTTSKPAVASFRLSNGINSYSQSGTYVRRIRGNSSITNFLGRNTSGDNEIYIQTTPGTYALIKTPDLARVSNRIIHRAELIVDQVYTPSLTDLFFLTPNFLYLDVADTANNYRPELCDFNVSSSSGPNFNTFGGYRTYVSDFQGHTISRYTFNVSRYVQNVITKQVSPRTFRLSSPTVIQSVPFSEQLCNTGTPGFNVALNQPVIGRVKLGGGNNLNYRMRLHIIYSRL